MTRKQKKEARRAQFANRRIDPNRLKARAAGELARTLGKPSTECPNFLAIASEQYGTQLCSDWMEGWFAKDAELKPKQLSLEGGATKWT